MKTTMQHVGAIKSALAQGDAAFHEMTDGLLQARELGETPESASEKLGGRLSPWQISEMWKWHDKGRPTSNSEIFAITFGKDK